VKQHTGFVSYTKLEGTSVRLYKSCSCVEDPRLGLNDEQRLVSEQTIAKASSKLNVMLT
jgi:hypothetical protein